jgi:hypothetical protein
MKGLHKILLKALVPAIATATGRSVYTRAPKDSAAYPYVYISDIYQEEDGRQRRLGSPFSWERELMESHIPQPTLFVPTRLYREVGEFDLQYRIAADYDMVLRLARRFPVRFVDQPVTLMMAGGISYTQMGRTFKEAARVSVSHGRPAAAVYLTYLRHMLIWQVARRVPVSFIEAWRRLRERL